MQDTEHSASTVTRREFVAGIAALGAVWMVAGTAGCTRDDTWKGANTAFKHFTPAQAAAIDAMSARILPSDGTPGAREAGVIHFIDQSLVGFAKEQAPLFAEGVKTLDAAAVKVGGASATFAKLTEAQQDAILKEIEKTPFFAAARFATLAGFLSLPKYGGNKDYIGWKFIGQEVTMEHKAPFGWYDRPENQMALLGKVL